MEYSNIADYLTDMAQRQPDALAIAIQQPDGRFREYSYQQLDEAVNRIVRGLQFQGIRQGTRTVVMERPGFEFFAIVFALFRLGAVLVAVDPGIGLKHLKKCLGEARPEAFIGNRKAHLARLLFGWAGSTLETQILCGDKRLPLPGLVTLRQVMNVGGRAAKMSIPGTTCDQTAAILFTSGSTGTPKGAVYTHANFLAQVDALRELYDIRPGEVDIATFPLFSLFAPALGMSAIIPDMDFTRPGSVDPGRIFAAIEHYQATTMFGSPALLDRCGRHGIEHGIQLPTLKRVLSAGAPVMPVIIERFSKLLAPGVQIYTPYGATEALPVCSIGSDEILGKTRTATAEGHGICVGRPAPGIDIHIIAINDEPLASWERAELLEPGKTGEIVVGGPQVTAKYFNRPEATLLAKLFSRDGKVHHRMGDTGYIDAEGRLWFCGRKSERVVDYDKVWYPACIEGVFNVHPKVRRTALVGIRRKANRLPALCVEIDPAHAKTDRRQLRSELLELGLRQSISREVRDIWFHPGFPVDIRHNAKIDRAALARWAAKQK